MKILNILSIILLCLIIASCKSTKVSSSKANGIWQATPIAVDGDSKDWPLPYPNYDSKGMIGYATSNDKENLYLTIETGDEYTQMKILKAGLTVWIDTTGRKEQAMSIQYPMPDENNPLEVPAGHGAEKASSQSDLHKREFMKKLHTSAADATQVSLNGFGSCDGGHLVGQNTCGIKVRIAMDEYNELVWEAAIPFKAIYNSPELTKAMKDKPISVCFAIKGFKKPAEKAEQGANMSNAGSGGMHGGGGGMHGGGHGTKGGGYDNPRDHLFESTRTWKQFTIAYQ